MDRRESVWHREAADANVEHALGDLQQLPILARFRTPSLLR
jgi:hypothetical protein